MMDIQQGDVLLFQTLDDGEISVSDGITTMTTGFDTAVYISLFGGNADDSGSDNNNKQYWGNFLADDSDATYRSETQFLLNSTPPITANLRPLHDAVKRDLEWMLSSGAATEIIIEVSLIGLNRVMIQIEINGDQSMMLTFEANWLASVQ